MTKSTAIDSLKQRDKLVKKLNLLIQSTEDIFLGFAHDYSMLLRETERSLAATRKLLACFQDQHLEGCADGQQGQNTLSLTILGTKEVVRDGIHYLEKMQGSDAELFARLEAGIRGLDGLDGRIRNIKEDSIEMELISLNAMTVALKAGTSGRAFSYITEELKRLSARIIELTDEVTANGEIVNQRFDELQTGMIDLEAYQSSVITEVNEELYRRFDEFIGGISTAASHLEALLREAGKVKSPLSKVMELTQNQDIIRQSVEHVLISLAELRENQEDADPESMLDEYTFFELMPRLCVSVLDDIESHIRKSSDAILENLEGARAELRKLDGLRGRIVKEILDQSGPGARTLHSLFAYCSDALRKNARELQEIISRKHSLGGLTLNLLVSIQALNGGFNHFSSLISRFQTIDIASRIEVAKNPVLDQMKSTVEEMTLLTQRIGNDVTLSFGVTTEFLKSSKDTIFQVREQFESQDSRIRRQESMLAQKLEQLEEGKDELDRMIRGFSVFSETFFKLFDKAQEDFLELEGLLTLISEARALFRAIEKEASQARGRLLRDLGLQEWNLRNERLQRIIQRFTIFGHKKAAGALAGFEVEDGVAAGDVTIF